MTRQTKNNIEERVTRLENLVIWIILILGFATILGLGVILK